MFQIYWIVAWLSVGVVAGIPIGIAWLSRAARIDRTPR